MVCPAQQLAATSDVPQPNLDVPQRAKKIHFKAHLQRHPQIAIFFLIPLEKEGFGIIILHSKILKKDLKVGLLQKKNSIE
jgi:hypothetical protein